MMSRICISVQFPVVPMSSKIQLRENTIEILLKTRLTFYKRQTVTFLLKIFNLSA